MSAADVALFIATLESVEKIGGVPSNTAKTQLWNQVADGLLQHIPQAMRSKIHEEIEQGVENMVSPEEREMAAIAHLHNKISERDAA